MKDQTQETKEQNVTKAQRQNPIRIVRGTRLGSENVETLREVHMSLVRAEQNLLNLVHASQGAGGATFGPAQIGYGTTQPFFGYNAPAFSPEIASGIAPGFVPGFLQSALNSGAGFGAHPIAATPGGALNGAAIPQSAIPAASIPAWGQTGAFAPRIGSQYAPGVIPSPLANGYVQSAIAPAIAASIARQPACDISDEGSTFVCMLDLPALRADQIELLCAERSIVVAAYREADSDIANLVQVERSTAPQQRTILLPDEIQPTGVKATLSNGVLTIVLPKVQPTDGPHRVKVQG
jgi:HSP20 family protein